MLFMVVICSVPVMADVPIEGIKQYSYQYVINNSADYPDYVFLTSSEIWSFEHPIFVINGTFGGGYKLDGFILHAIKNADLDAAVKEKLSAAGKGENNFSTYFESAPIATSDILLPVSTGMNDTIPVNNITVILEVKEIKGDILNVTKVKKLLGFENGSIIEEISDETGKTDISGEEDIDLLHII